MKQHVLIRFGKWQEILDQPLPEDPELYCVTTAMMHYARAVAYASTERVDEAVAEQQAFYAARDRVPESRMLFNNTCLDILAVAEAMMTGEVEYRRGSFDAAFEHLGRAVELDDNLPYDEPWGWMQPTRHALGALLMEQGRLDEAEAAYRADLGSGRPAAPGLLASRQRLEPARPPRVPDPPGRDHRGQPHQAAPRPGPGPSRRQDRVVLLLPPRPSRLNRRRRPRILGLVVGVERAFSHRDCGGVFSGWL